MIPLPQGLKDGIAKVLKDISTSRDGESFDVIRVTLIFGGLAFVFCGVWDVIVNTHFNALEFGGGLGAMAGGSGVGIGAKAKDEPESVD
jgi:hypothetical protein